MLRNMYTYVNVWLAFTISECQSSGLDESSFVKYNITVRITQLVSSNLSLNSCDSSFGFFYSSHLIPILR